jgi:ribosomal peptide maturation radical SAM protein 1
MLQDGGDALIVVLPFQDPRVPSLAAHLLQGCARQAGLEVSVFYANLVFARWLGLEDYELLCCPTPELYGERVFARAAWNLPRFGRDGDRFAPDDPVPCLRAGRPSTVPFARLARIEELAGEFVVEVARSIAPLAFRAVGFTMAYEQAAAASAIAARIKRADPGKTTMAGGFACKREMADGMASLGPGFDFVFSGESESALVTFLQELRSGRRPARRVVSGVACADLGHVPLPDYTDFMTQVSRTLPELAASECVIPYEASRGCLWGESRRCAFCGSGDERGAFREKPAEAVTRELAVLAARYPAAYVDVADADIPQTYHDTVMPSLASAPLNVRLSWAVRADVTASQVQAMRRAGVLATTIGIESLSTALLTKMGKGMTAAQAIAALRYCRAAGIDVTWLMLYGIPGDALADYAGVETLMPLLRHLQPPLSVTRVRLHRFSPYAEEPGGFGITAVRPVDAYRQVFPDHAEVDKLAYMLEGEYPSESAASVPLLRRIEASVRAWRLRWEDRPDTWPALSIEPVSGALGSLAGGLYLLRDTRGLPDTVDSQLVTREQAAVALAKPAGLPPALLRWALDARVGALVDDAYVPLATARPGVIVQFESVQKGLR